VLRRLWAQIAALGVGQIVLTSAERVERHYFDTARPHVRVLPAAAGRRIAAGARHATAHRLRC
jgi:hypothetical protein